MEWNTVHEQITFSKWQKSLSHKSDFFLIDVRTFHEWSKSHIPGAMNIPLYEIGQNVDKLPQNKILVVYCQNTPCSMSDQAVHELKLLGFQNARKLEGGIDEWNVQGFHVESENEILPISRALSNVALSPPNIDKIKQFHTVSPKEPISSDHVVDFLESRSPIFEFEYGHIDHGDSNISLGYEIKTVEEINAIYLLINPDPRNIALVPPGSLVISHHKISCYDNWVYRDMIDQARIKKFNVYNYHLAWDTMVDGIADSFLFHLGIPKEDTQKVDLTYKGNKIPRLGSIVKSSISLQEIITQMHELNVSPSVIVNPKCQNSKVGYIPGGGFVDSMMLQMADYGIDVLISSDSNWVVEIIARELDMTLIVIDHYISERYGLQAMQQVLTKAFPKTPAIILENVDSVQCPPDDCPCCEEGHLHSVPIK